MQAGVRGFGLSFGDGGSDASLLQAGFFTPDFGASMAPPVASMWDPTLNAPPPLPGAGYLVSMMDVMGEQPDVARRVSRSVGLGPSGGAGGEIWCSCALGLHRA